MHILRSMSALLLCAAVASCSQEEFVTGKGQALPDGEYPLQFIASVEGMKSRAAGKDVWEDNDIIAAKIYPSDNSDYPVVGKYILNENGEIKKADPPVAWPYTDGTVKAWFPYVDWDKTITDSISDQSGGMKPYDFLTAIAEDKNYKENIKLTFTHQMAKVTCVLHPGDGISDEEWKTVKLRIAGFTEVSFCNGEVTGSYSEDNKDKKWITPFYDSEASVGTDSVYEALVVPQDMSGQEFIKIEITVKHNIVEIPKTLIYTTDEEKLEAGKRYVYNITVQKDRLVVESIAASWHDQPVNTTVVPRKVYLQEDENADETDKWDYASLIFSENVTPRKEDGTEAASGEKIAYLDVIGPNFSISYKIDTEKGNQKKSLIPENEDLIAVNRRLTKLYNTSGEREDYYSFECNIKTLSDDTTLKYGDHLGVGDYYYEDGSWGYGNLENLKTIGIVFKVGPGNTNTYNINGSIKKQGDIDTPANYYTTTPEGKVVTWVDADPGREIRGYVVALKDAYDKPGMWGYGDKQIPALLFGISNVGSDTNIFMTKYSGYINSNAIKSNQHYIDTDTVHRTQEVIVSADGEKKDIYYAGHWAFKVANEYRPEGLSDNTPAAPEESYGWYLPSAQQLKDLVAMNLLDITIIGAGGLELDYTETGYWSSSETGKKTAFAISLAKKNNSETLGVSNIDKNKEHYVRAVLTF